MINPIPIIQKATQKNDEIAEQNRAFFQKLEIPVINLISSPGSGKTTLLERLGERLKEKLAVLTGDIQTTLDADRISKSGAKAIQIETGGSCHLTAQQVKDNLAKIDFKAVELLIIENIGNLVCPASYDLGEDYKIAVLSLAEGDEKPLKYPALFTRSEVLIINKIDLAPYLDFDFERVKRDCYKLNNKLKLFETSATKDKGIDQLLAFLLASKKKTEETVPA